MLKQWIIPSALLAVTLTSSAQTPVTPLRIGGDVKPPTLIRRVEPQYTEEARKAGVSGTVRLEGIVRKDGTISDVRVVQALGFGLDDKALEAVMQWRFSPATKDGEPVDAFLSMEVSFHVLLRVGGDVKPPTVLQAVEAKYTDEAAKANVKGAVGLEFIVYYDGHAKITKVTKSLGHGLDESARAALEQTRFNPGTKEGRPVDVMMEAEVTFPQPK